MIDIHSHLLYGVDDGSKNKEMTLNMLRIAEASGTKKIVITPHFVRGHYEYDFRQLNHKFKELKRLVKRQKIKVQLFLGQEVYCSEKMLDDFKAGRISTINNSRYMLIEMPLKTFNTTEVLDAVYEMKLQGIVPIIAHPERYVKFIEDNLCINKFIEEGCLFQLNSGSISGQFGRKVKKTAKVFLKNNIYNFIGSDAHRDTKRKPNLKPGIKKIKRINKDALNVFVDSGEKLLLNKDIKFVGKKIVKKKYRLFSR